VTTLVWRSEPASYRSTPGTWDNLLDSELANSLVPGFWSSVCSRLHFTGDCVRADLLSATVVSLHRNLMGSPWWRAPHALERRRRFLAIRCRRDRRGQTAFVPEVSTQIASGKRAPRKTPAEPGTADLFAPACARDQDPKKNPGPERRLKIQGTNCLARVVAYLRLRLRERGDAGSGRMLSLCW
jgi:hypothetical protein